MLLSALTIASREQIRDNYLHVNEDDLKLINLNKNDLLHYLSYYL